MEKSLLYPTINRTRTDQKLDGLWQFSFDPEGSGIAQNWANGLPATIDLPVPASFNDFFTDKADREYTGVFWYARQFFVSADAQERFVGLRFDAVTHRAAIFVNGHKVGTHEGGFLPLSSTSRPWCTSARKIPSWSRVTMNCPGKIYLRETPSL
ncbi:beta-glucuronidase [Schleiferilactobacillus perolens DSM 12744]|uniref:Beta-glucuronidase n=1 Tax=Schleiferilactobacillus perolens DSM 12744 TaxID=1423792 RepID=A0A0R1NBP9_9LACO|nr:beta-glucuronidase [Schleiferilactobacillus perolens DSM 12744]